MPPQQLLPFYVPDVPARVWKPFHSRTWVDYMPPPRLQLKELLPRNRRGKITWGGTCCIHTYYEAFTARMLIKCEEWWGVHLSNLEADLPGMIFCAAGHGVLVQQGAYATEVSRIARYHGIPLRGNIPVAALVPLQPHQRPWALGTSLNEFPATPLPYDMCEIEIDLCLGNPETRDAVMKAMGYREHICSCIDEGPILVFLHPQSHYYHPRLPGVPYKRKLEEVTVAPELDLSMGHYITIYAYACPGGDVRSLVLYYQENMKGAPHADCAGRYTIDPDAVELYFTITMDNLEFRAGPRNHELLYPVQRKRSLMQDAVWWAAYALRRYAPALWEIISRYID